jgi:hypothetical protein
MARLRAPFVPPIGIQIALPRRSEVAGMTKLLSETAMSLGILMMFAGTANAQGFLESVGKAVGFRDAGKATDQTGTKIINEADKSIRDVTSIQIDTRTGRPIVNTRFNSYSVDSSGNVNPTPSPTRRFVENLPGAATARLWDRKICRADALPPSGSGRPESRFARCVGQNRELGFLVARLVCSELPALRRQQRPRGDA